MRKLVIISAIIIFAFTVSAQERFYNLYEGWSCKKVVENSSGYNVWGKDYHTSGRYMVIRQSINSNGEYISTDNNFFLEPYLATHIYNRPDILVSSGQSSFFTGYVQYDDNGFYPLFMKYDEQLQDTIFSKVYNNLIEGQTIFHTSCFLNNHIYTLGTTTSDFEVMKMTFHKIDTSGNVLITKIFDPTYPHIYADIRYPLQVTPTNDSGFILTFEEPIYGGYLTNQNTFCLRVDSLGNEKWRCEIGHHDTVNYSPFVFPLDNGNFIFTYSDPLIVNTTDPNFSPMSNESSTIWIGEINSLGQILWKHNLGHDINLLGRYFVSDVHIDEQNNIYLAGNMTHYDEMAFLMKINSQHQAVWMQQFICFPENSDAGLTNTKVYGLTATNDGGFILAGEFLSSDSEMFSGGIQSSLIIKVDECGCLEEGCNPDCFTTIPQAQHIRMLELEIYPNPADDHLRINFDGVSGWLKLFDCRGQVCLEQKYGSGTVLDISTFVSGVYTVRVNASGKFFQGQFIKE